MSISRAQLVEAHLDHPVRIPVRIPEADLTVLEREIYNGVKASPGNRMVFGDQQARIEHRSGRRAVHWRQELERIKGHDYAEKVLAALSEGYDLFATVHERRGPVEIWRAR